MRRLVFTGSAILASVMCLMQASAADKKELADVKMDDLIRGTQHLVKGETGMNMVWFVPNEFWGIALAGNKSLTPDAKETFVRSLDGVFVLVVIRGDVTPGKTYFYDMRTIRDNLTVTFADADGKVHEVSEVYPPPVEMESVLGAMKPMFKSLLGAMGDNMQMFVFKDTDADGKRTISPYEEGTLKVDLKPLPKVSGGSTAMPMPIDALFVPRHCEKCSHDCQISWKFCPYCGAALPK